MTSLRDAPDLLIGYDYYKPKISSQQLLNYWSMDLNHILVLLVVEKTILVYNIYKYIKDYVTLVDFDVIVPLSLSN